VRLVVEILRYSATVPLQQPLVRHCGSFYNIPDMGIGNWESVVASSWQPCSYRTTIVCKTWTVL